MKKLLIAAIAASIASGAWALQSDREQQIEVHADQFNGDEVKQTAVYSGAVVVDQGSMRLTGDVLELRITPKGYRQATITGAPARFRQQRDPDAQNPVDEWMHAEAKRIVYDEETDKVTLTGGARLSRSENGVEKDMTQGERIVYDHYCAPHEERSACPARRRPASERSLAFRPRQALIPYSSPS